MKKLLAIMLLFVSTVLSAQITVELTPAGFEPVSVERPERPLEKLIEITKAWPVSYNRNSDYGYDVYNVTENSLSIDAYRENAFYYRNRGEVYQHRIRYTIDVEFAAEVYTLKFSIKEIYYGNTLTKLSVANFFAPDGRLKEDYEEVKPSLEYSANQMLNSLAQYINRN